MDRQSVTLGILCLAATVENMTSKCGVIVCLAERSVIVWYNPIMMPSSNHRIIES